MTKNKPLRFGIVKVVTIFDQTILFVQIKIGVELFTPELSTIELNRRLDVEAFQVEENQLFERMISQLERTRARLVEYLIFSSRRWFN